ncbi:MAG: monovalent cation/H+ antiporter complex subunit F [Luteolibacter sp.]|jgi:multicomponent Na+:H+ antiporter subunit F
MSDLPSVALLIAKILLVLALFIGSVRLFLGPTLADRVIALDLISGIVFSFAVIVAIESEEALFLDVAFAIAVVSFLGTVVIARLMERSASHD